MRLIDADKLIKNIESDRNCSDMPSQWIDGVNYAINLIELYEPTIDIVRCGECKWLRYCETEEMELTLDCDHPDGGGIPRSEEWFCADGEREGE
jgi:hypothetical protein